MLLLISDLHMMHEEIMILEQFYKDAQSKPEIEYEIVWLPVVDTSKPLNEETQSKFHDMQIMMPWYTLVDPSLLDPAVVRYIKEVWRFTKKAILVVLDIQGKVVCQNALHMMWIWGNFAHPFSSLKEESLWKEETWRLELLIDAIDSIILNWVVPFSQFFYRFFIFIHYINTEACIHYVYDLILNNKQAINTPIIQIMTSVKFPLLTRWLRGNTFASMEERSQTGSWTSTKKHNMQQVLQAFI